MNLPRKSIAPPVLILLLISWLELLVLAVSTPLGKDENMYLAAASLLKNGRLYADFAFFQTPYSVWIYSLLDQLIPGDWILLSARLFKSLVAAGLLWALYRLIRKLGSDPLLSALLVSLLAHNTIIRQTVCFARNYDFAQLAILCGLLLLPLHSDQWPGSKLRFRLTAAGFLAALAVGFKLTYAPLAILVFCWPVLAFPRVPEAARSLKWLFLGGLLGIMPALVSMVGIDPLVLRFNIWDYHQLNHLYKASLGIGSGQPYPGRLDDARRLYIYGDNLALVFLTIVGMAMAFIRVRFVLKPSLVTAAFFVVASILILVIPSPVLPSYYAPLMIGLVLVVAALSGRLSARRYRWLQVFAALSFLVSLGHQIPSLTRATKTASRVETWPPVLVHRAGEQVARLTESSPDRPVVTTRPIYVLEAGRPLPREFSTGSFGWRLNQLIDSDMQKKCTIVTENTVYSWLGGLQHAAIVLVNGDITGKTLKRWAEAEQWEIAGEEGKIQIWMDPTGVPEVEKQP